jgi:hypothetical protein
MNIPALRRWFLKGILALVPILILMMPPKGSADVGNKRTVVTFSAPVEIPGNKVLPAGTYVFKLLDSTGTRNVVQIYNEDETRMLATILGISDSRLNPPDRNVFTFEERASGSPEAIRSWFYPGDLNGVQFVYPHQEAAQIAKRTHNHVLSMPDQEMPSVSANAKSPSDPGVQALEHAHVAAVDPSGKDEDMSQAVAASKTKNR